MAKVTYDYSRAKGFIRDHEMESMKAITEEAKKVLLSKSGAGNDYLGWIDLPVDYDKDEFARIKQAAAKIQSDSEVLVVIGIGGSYLGARAAIEFLRHNFYNSVSKEIRKTPEIYFVGNSISSTYISNLIDVIGDRDFSVNIISKSGTTTEPAIAFRIFKKMLEKKYGKEEAAKRIYATTDKATVSLKNLATAEGYETFVVPDDVGGRFSVLTAVGLLAIAASGADIDKLMEGAASARERCLNAPFEENDSMLYAAVRNILLRKGKSVEILCDYEPSLHYTLEWWKQLMGESEGKDGKGLLSNTKDNYLGQDFSEFTMQKNIGYVKDISLYGDTYQIYVLRQKDAVWKQLAKNVPLLFFLIFINTLLPFFLMTLIERSVTVRIAQLGKVFDSVDSEKLIEIKNVQGDDEISQLMHNYNRMADRTNGLIQTVYKDKLREREMSLAKKNAELLALHVQINPHFLFNALESIRMHSI